MLVKCHSCGKLIDDSFPTCPNCGCPSDGTKTPKTIDELRQWYDDRSLPPYETTRFFIGIDYPDPRAFGIYQDSQTGKFIVYKNKDNGERAIRYSGRNEAYAVNELLQRLKQEIYNQKTRNSDQTDRISNHKQTKSSGSGFLASHPVLKFLAYAAGFIIGLPFLFLSFLMILGSIIIMVEPKTGYYEYDSSMFYLSELSYGDDNCFVFSRSDSQWEGPLGEKRPEIFEKRSSCKKYYISKNWNSSMRCTDFESSVFMADLEAGLYPSSGYYKYDGKWYYHLLSRYDLGWYVFDTEWHEINFKSLPYQLQHTSQINEYYVSESFENSFPVDNFEDTLAYKDFKAGSFVDRGYYQVDNTTYYHLYSDYSQGWYVFEDAIWSLLDSEDFPEVFTHPSMIEDYYYVPDWNNETYLTDFEETDIYQDYLENQESSGNSSWSDSDYDWSSDDSWDSGSTDFSSDW